MYHSNSIKIIFYLLIVVLLFNIISCNKDKNQPTEIDREATTAEDLMLDGTSSRTIPETKAMPVEQGKYFQQIPISFWPKIQIFGTISVVIVTLALLVGIIMYIVGYYGGGRLNKAKINTAVIIASLIGIIGRTLIISIQVYLTTHLNKLLHNEMIAATIVDFILYAGWITFIAGISVNLYEAFIVTAKEAHPMD